MNVKIYEPQAKVKANETWVNRETGVVYTVLSVKSTSTSRRYGGRVRMVEAYTYDLSVDRANGTWDGKKCRWANEEEWNFIEAYEKGN